MKKKTVVVLFNPHAAASGACVGGLALRPVRRPTRWAADRAREEALEESLGSASLSADGLPDGNARRGGGISSASRPRCPLSEVYAAVEPFAYSLLSGSENRLFLLYLNDAEAFSQRYADKLLYGKRTFPAPSAQPATSRTRIRSPRRRSRLCRTPKRLPAGELAELGVYDALSVTDGSGVTVAVLDSGIDRAHSAFADADIAAGYDAVAHRPGVDGDASGHGTRLPASSPRAFPARRRRSAPRPA